GSADGSIFKITSENNIDSTVLVDPVINSGITYFEVIFRDHEGGQFRMGVADAKLSFGAGEAPQEYGSIGDLLHIGTTTKGNTKYLCGQRVGVEVDMKSTPRTVTFFVDDIEQPNRIVGVPAAIRFFAFISISNSSFEIKRLKRRFQSSARGVKGTRSLEWGKTS
ncbi:MAG: hypothetical protein EZS28_044990, partial [Streblomastix strix]